MSAIKKDRKSNSYKKFDRIDGSHPLRKAIPSGYVDYPARIRKGGKVVYFNFELAKEMGLIPKSHDHILNEELQNKILETFSIQIINEFDQMKNRVFPDSEMKKGQYMATRYLQLQHEDKKGRTSGDGRSIWNGQVQNRDKSWDISSCGTGGTRLSPATSKYNKFFETGDPSISYGCGYAEIDEGFTTAIYSNIFHQNERQTERSLAVIEFKDNIAINIRTHQSLLRPSHVFLYLKQDDHTNLKSVMDYYIDSQREVLGWEKCPTGKSKYDFFLKKFTKTFSHLSADLEDEYIFCWLDWDGDNILMDGGIIDYGSVRQFGLCHSEYRYDDIDRFSTNLLEQRTKAKYIVQTMAQAVEYIKSSEKKSIQDYAKSDVINLFEQEYEDRKNKNLLKRIGLSERKSKQLIKRDLSLVTDFRKVFSSFELAKSHRGEVKISDGVTTDAIFSMGNFLREFPQIRLHTDEDLAAKDILDILWTPLADTKDCELNKYRKQKLQELQSSYVQIVSRVSRLFQEDMDDTLLEVIKRSHKINKVGKATGDAITFIVDFILKQKKSMTSEEIFELINEIGAYQNCNPDSDIKMNKKIPSKNFEAIIEIFNEHRDGI